MKYLYRITALLCVTVMIWAALTAGALSAREPQTHSSYINGASDGYFYPNNFLTRAQAAQMIYNITGTKTGRSSFSDVSRNAWYYTAVSALSSSGIIKGYADNTFRPNKALTKAELVRILVNLAEKSSEIATPSFSDVPRTHWAYASIGVAEANGWINGSDGLFHPDDSITRAQAVAMINRFLGRHADKTSIDAEPLLCYYPDVDPSDWFYYEIAEASVTHKASGVDSEVWTDAENRKTSLPAGFYMINGELRLVKGGAFVLSSERGTFAGVTYTADKNGIITVTDGVVAPVGGKPFIVSNGKTISEDGLYDAESGLYCIENGSVKTNGYYKTLYFGEDGRYTSGNSDIDEYIDAIVASETNSSMTQTEKLRALYDYIYNNVNYRANNNHVPRGASASEWTEEYMLRLISAGKGNCYCYAAEMYYLARRIGYYSATAVSGGVTPDNLDHGWVTVTIDGETLLLDPELDSSSGLTPGSVFLVTYKDAPFRYFAN